MSDRLYLNGVSGENFAIYDQHGKLLVKQKLPEQNGIDVSSLIPGVYVLLIDDSMTTRFVKE
ncbi:MAG: T9SS type A sorting domain-containing protein [Saprospiraceae bacterium]|nr:T9SS type A sorting domain-containing protein [Saprospiraceae bacterium]